MDHVVERKYDFFIVGDDFDWEEKVLQELQKIRPGIKCLSRKDAVLGKFIQQNLIEQIPLCKKVVVGFSSQPASDTPEFVSISVIQGMLNEKSIGQGRLIPVKITEDAVVPDHLQSLITAGNFWEDDFYEKLLHTVDKQDIDDAAVNKKQSRCGSTEILPDHVSTSLHSLSENQQKSIRLKASHLYQLIERLQLQDYYPQRLTHQKAREVSHNIALLGDCTDVGKIPWFILKNIILGKYKGCQNIFCTEVDSVDEKQVSPLDALIVLFMCCNNDLRKILVEKMFKCKLSIPLLLPFVNRIPLTGEMLLWAMNKQWELTCEKSSQVQELLIVSALRLGRPQISKSKTLNGVIELTEHDYFFHSGCNKGSLETKLSDGLIESACYIPVTKKGLKPVFSKPVAFLNLRGNATCLKGQTDFMSNISMAIIAFISSNDFEKDHRNILESLYKQTGHVILVSDGGTPTESLKESIDSLNEDSENGSLEMITSSIANVDKAIWKSLHKISDKIKVDNVKTNKSIKGCNEIARTIGFYIPDFLQKEEIHKEKELKEGNGDKSQKNEKDVKRNEFGNKSRKKTGRKDSVSKCDKQKDVFQDVIVPLSLQEFYPRKLTCEKALIVSKNMPLASAKLPNAQIPWIMLRYLLMCNYNGRSFVSPKKASTCTSNSSECSKHSSNTMTGENIVSPMDTLVALFLCSDNFLRQLLVEKLSMCQLAIPLLLPLDSSGGPSYEVLVWAMSTLRKQWKNKEGKTCAQSMAVHPLPIVSVIRIGHSKISKSKILNMLMSDDLKHDMFFHYECKGGPVKRKICDGLIELGWYLPRGKNDVFHNPVTFLNLRGNASHLQKHVSFLSKISCGTIGFTSSDTFEEEDAVLLESLYRQGGHFILVVDDQPEDKLLEFQEKNKRSIGFINCFDCNEIDIKEQIWANLTPLLNENKHLVPNRSIDECADIARTLDFKVDEDTPDCLHAKEYATDMLKSLKQTKKEQVLPLQTIVKKIGYAKKEEFRQKSRGNVPVEAYRAEIQRSVHVLRENQMACYENASVIFKKYQNSLGFETVIRKYFCGYVKILTDRYSYDILKPVQEEYIKKWNELCEAQKKHTDLKKKVENYQKDLSKAEHKLQSNYFGFNKEVNDLKVEIHQCQQMEKKESVNLKSRKQKLDSLEQELADLSLNTLIERLDKCMK